VNYHRLRTREEKALGVLGCPLRSRREALLFEDVLPGTRFIMDGVRHDLMIDFLDSAGNVIETVRMQALTGSAIAPGGTAHAVERLP